MKILFIGGTGVISSACTDLALARGYELYLLNRGQSQRPIPDGAKVLQADIRQPKQVASILGDQRFDAVVDWVAFEPAHIQTDIELFASQTGQFVFISSASAYQKPLSSLPITESTPLHNPYWPYSQAKIACEELLIDAYRQQGFPITIVRPSHTYDRTMLPFHGGYTIIDRMRHDREVIVPGDGTSLWVLTHHRDFARGFVPLLGDGRTIGQTFHITSDEVLTWNQIYMTLAHAAGVRNPNLIHIPSTLLAAYSPELGMSLLGDKSHSVFFDNTKIKRFVPGYHADIPFAQGAREIINWYDADPNRQVVNSAYNTLIDQILSAYYAAFP